MKSIIMKIFGIHDTQLKKSNSKYKSKITIAVGALMMIAAPLLLISINNKVAKIVEQKQKIAIFFIRKIDKDYMTYLDTGKITDKKSTTEQDACVLDKFVENTRSEIKFFKEMPYIFALFLFFSGFESVKRGLYSIYKK